MPTLKKGDLIKDKYGVRKVLGVCGEVVHVSYASDHNVCASTQTEPQLKENGYTWDTPAWKPKIDDRYWFVAATGKPECDIWRNDKLDQTRKDFLGIHQTPELCRAALLEIRRKLGK